MKKTTKVKYVKDVKVGWSFNDIIEKTGVHKKIPDLKQIDQVYFQTEENRIIQGFLYLNKGKPVLIPEPQPSQIYYANAERIVDEIIEIRNEIFNSPGFENVPKVDALFSDFFLLSFSFITSLFASFEAFNNCVIPDNYIFIDKKRNEKLDRESIQRNTTFDVKVKKIVPDIFKKSFINDYHNKYKLILEIKELRDNLIHTKNFSKNWAASYRDIYRGLLSFKFDNGINYIKDYMNYYKKDWIEN